MTKVVKSWRWNGGGDSDARNGSGDNIGEMVVVTTITTMEATKCWRQKWWW